MNGKTKLILWCAGVFVTILIAVISFMGNVVYANQIENSKEHTAIRKEVVVEVKEIRKDQTIIKVQQAEILALLKAQKHD